LLEVSVRALLKKSGLTTAYYIWVKVEKSLKFPRMAKANKNPELLRLKNF